MVETDEAFRTADMSLATVLFMEGYPYRLERIGPHEAVWVFEDERCSAEEFEVLVEKYEQHGVRVEPRNFVRYFTQVRRDLFSFVPPDPRRGRGSRRPGVSSVNQD